MILDLNMIQNTLSRPGSGKTWEGLLVCPYFGDDKPILVYVRSFSLNLGVSNDVESVRICQTYSEIGNELEVSVEPARQSLPAERPERVHWAVYVEKMLVIIYKAKSFQKRKKKVLRRK